VKRLRICLALTGGLLGCAVDVATLKFAAPDRPTAAVGRIGHLARLAEGESCRLWVLGISGLPQIDEAMRDAMQPVQGVYMVDTTVVSAHPVYLLFGWHCYRVRGEVFG
jgi:hypothetical protein